MRLVARGFSQIHGVDYDETFAPVVRITSLRIFLAIACHLDYRLTHVDVKGAFLNADLEEELYLEIPEGLEIHASLMKGFDVLSQDELCLLLLKNLYGLKQAGRSWYRMLNDFLTKYGFERSPVDNCIYIYRKGNGYMALMAYVDDIVIMCEFDDDRKDFMKTFTNEFIVTDLGDLSWYLGIAIEKGDDGCYYAHQEKYIMDMVRRFGLIDAKVKNTPITMDKLTRTDCPTDEEKKFEMMNVPYRSLVGSLLYACTCTRPDIAFAVSNVSRFMSNPGMVHWTAAKRILRYLKGTKDLKLKFNPDCDLKLSGYCDADWGGELDTRRSTTGYTFLYGNCGISWKSKLQKTVALSSAEAEYMGITAATQECMYLRSLLRSLGYGDDDPTIIFEDNQACIAMTKNPVLHGRSKHIDIRHHYVREKVESKEVSVTYRCTEDMLADVLTKSLSGKRHRMLCSRMMGMND